MKKDNIKIKILIFLFFVLVSFGISSGYCIETTTLEEKQLIEKSFGAKGQKITFSYPAEYDHERQIIYKICDVAKNENDSGSKADIGIALVDLNDDGEKEILAHISHVNYCGSRGCTFTVLKMDRTGQWQKFWEIAADNITILETKSNNFRDFLFYGESYDGLNKSWRSAVKWIWKFIDKQYGAYAKMERYQDYLKEIETITLWKFNTKTENWDVIDRKERILEKSK